MSEEAQLVFCPYSYVINPIIRRAMEVDLKGAVVILDEAQYASLASYEHVTLIICITVKNIFLSSSCLS